jgi:UDP-2,3-diacylglucosamine pyrophosphatase LpxH
LRTLWISDVHLGTRACRAELLLDFLKHHKAETIYLVGDIVDGWQLKKSWYWPQSHNDLVQKILRQARKGTEIIYIPGNHDHAARLFLGHRFGGVLIARHVMHDTADGKRLWVTHGDRFDAAVRYSRLLTWFGGSAYDAISSFNLLLEPLRRWLGLSHWSLVAWIKRRSRHVEDYLAAYERAAVAEARRRRADGVVCGHIHTAALKTVDGLLYCNDGDWVENCSALAEHADGRLEMLRWGEPVQAPRPATSTAAAARPLIPEGVSS